MKSILLMVLFVTTSVSNNQKYSPSKFRVTTFTNVPKDMEGCGEYLFLNKEDEKKERYIFYTEYFSGLICVNNKTLLLPLNKRLTNKIDMVFSNDEYTLIIKHLKEKPIGDEDYEIKSAIMTIKYHSKVIWTKNVIGGGGC